MSAGAAPALPRLHVVTDDEVLGTAGFGSVAAALIARCGRALALQLRGHRTPARVLYGHAALLRERAAKAGALLAINDRVDVALAARLPAVQLGVRSLPLATARRLLPRATIGFSAHGVEQAAAAVRDGTDLVIMGTIYRTASHAGREPAGPQRIAGAAALGVPIIAIGGITPARVAALAAAGAYGVAVLGGIWRSDDPLAAAAAYVAAIEQAYGTREQPCT